MKARRGRVVTALCALLLCAAIPGAAQDLWYVQYQEGVSAFKRGDLATAEQKLGASIENRLAPKTRGRRVPYYGQLRDEFIPEFYLAAIALQRQRFDEALAFAGKADAFIASGDKDFASLQRIKNEARQQLAALNARNTPPAPTDTTRPQTVMSPPKEIQPVAQMPATPTMRAEIEKPSTRAAEQIGAPVQPRATIAATPTPAQTLAAQLTALVDQRNWRAAAQAADQLAIANPSAPELRIARAAIARAGREDIAARLERDGLIAFYRGDYQTAFATLSKVEADVATVRTTLYRACSLAALALLEGDKGAPTLARARGLFRGMGSATGVVLARDRKYISPQVLAALEGRQATAPLTLSAGR